LSALTLPRLYIFNKKRRYGQRGLFIILWVNFKIKKNWTEARSYNLPYSTSIKKYLVIFTNNLETVPKTCLQFEYRVGIQNYIPETCIPPCRRIKDCFWYSSRLFADNIGGYLIFQYLRWSPSVHIKCVRSHAILENQIARSVVWFSRLVCDRTHLSKIVMYRWKLTESIYRKIEIGRQVTMIGIDIPSI